MKRLFAVINLILGIWLFICPWVLGYSGTLAHWGDCAVGLVTAALSIYILLLKMELPTPNWPYLIDSILGAWLIVSGIFVFGQVSFANRWNDIALGILVACSSLFASQIIEGKKAFAYTKDGGVLIEMVNITHKDGIIVIKGKTFGTMPAVMHMRPVDLWNLLGLVPLSIIANLPRMLIAGWRKSKETSKVVKNTK